jgi:hypothetical protein
MALPARESAMHAGRQLAANPQTKRRRCQKAKLALPAS